MNPKKAIEHFKWKFAQRGKMTERDKDALNCLIQYYNVKEEQKMKDYTMFGKFYIVLLQVMVKHYNCSVMSKEPHKAIGKILEKSTGQLAQRFTNFLNNQEIYTIFDMAGREPFQQVHISHLEAIYKEGGTPEEEWLPKIEEIQKKRRESNERLEKLLEHHPDVKELIYKGKNIWELDTVIEILNKSISELIYRHDNE